MFEITMNGTVYKFKFGIGFVKEVSTTAQRPVDGMPGKMEDVGLTIAIGKVMDGDILGLVDVLFTANKGFEPRVSKQTIETYLDDECEDIDEFFKQVLDFFKEANATRKATMNLQEAVAEEKQRRMKEKIA